MFCIQCGTKNPEASLFCNKCGVRFSGEEDTRISTKTKYPESNIFTVRPTLMFVQVGYVAAVMCSFLMVIILSVLGKSVGIFIPWWLSVFGGFALLLIPIFYHAKRNFVKYTLTDSRIEIDEGFISKETRKIPLRAVQDVVVSSSVAQRILGLGDLIIENANESDEKIVLKNINSPKHYADLLLRQMRLLDK
jgi:uncharacterized membrane protein YdbT with pleckstrin-like domain